jgi:hypothetical protein
VHAGVGGEAVATSKVRQICYRAQSSGEDIIISALAKIGGF